MYIWIYMKQYNINITKDFEQDLSTYMKLTDIKVKVDAIRHALKESVKRLTENTKSTDFNSWIGAGLKSGINHCPKFKSEDDLW